MVRISLSDVSIEFPIFGAHAASIKRTLVSAATGGAIGNETGVTIIKALDGITLDLRSGDRLGIVGHNGAGKTTLLRLLAGIYPPTRGAYFREGTVSSLIDPMMGIELDATGYENIFLKALMLGVGRRDVPRLCDDVAEFSGLGDYLEIPVRTYSTGMMMRLGFSIATAVRRDILIMDEWLAVGDSGFRQHAESRLRDIVDSTRIMVLASHSHELIARECNRVIELRHGAICS